MDKAKAKLINDKLNTAIDALCSAATSLGGVGMVTQMKELDDYCHYIIDVRRQVNDKWAQGELGDD